MKFVVLSSELLSHLQAVSKVINSKNTLPILDNFLFDLNDTELVITASDLETTLITHLTLENVDGEGKIAVPAKILTDTLKEFSGIPLTFEINLETLAIDIYSENGKFSIVGQPGEDFPVVPELKSDATTIELNSDVLQTGISRTLFATADDELRPVMNGIFLQFTPDHLTFVASDSHKLVRYRRSDVNSEADSSFILPKKPASLLKNILPKEVCRVTVQFNEQNAHITMANYKMICRLIEGKFPNYEAVIPTDNPNKMIIDRVEFYNSIKRVSVFSNQASNLVKFELNNNQITVSAQDLDFSISAYERLNSQYDGDLMEIGFKSAFLLEILSNIPSENVTLEMSDPARAGLLSPVEKDIEAEDILMLLMPMMING